MCCDKQVRLQVKEAMALLDLVQINTLPTLLRCRVSALQYPAQKCKETGS